jgi:hypothetical protein
MKAASFAFVALLIAGAAVHAQTPMRPGRWEVTMQMQMPNLPVQMPEMKTTQCVTPEQLKDPASTVPRGPQGNRGSTNQDCKVSDYKASGNKVTWNMSCTTPEPMSSSGEMTFADDSYTGTMTMKSPQGDMSMKLSGKRLGECTP